MTATIIKAADEADLIMAMHDRAMQAKGPDAAIARGLKELLPAMMRWLESEIERGTEPADLIICTNHVVISAHVSALASQLEGFATVPGLLREVVAHLDDRYRAAIEKIEQDEPA